MKGQTETELKFLVPPAMRAALAAELARGAATVERRSLTAMYLDTPDRRLARAGLSWRVRREGRRWVQALKTGSANALERFEHEVIRPDARHDAALHAGTPAGERLIALLREAAAQGLEPEQRYRTEVRRTARRVRTRGAVVEVALDEGRLVAAGASQRILEIEFELVTGSVAAMLALAQRWRQRFGLIIDPRSKSERGDRLAEGSACPPLRKACQPSYAEDADAAEAFGSVLDECLAQITCNAIGLVEGDPALRVDHVHQLRVGIRRLRSALRSFRRWTPAPPDELVGRLRALFTTLGLARESDVLGAGVAAELAKVGAPPLALPADAAGPDPGQVLRDPDVQGTLLAWIAWRATLNEAKAGPAAPGPNDGATPQAPAADAAAAALKKRSAGDDAAAFRRRAERRLRRWHARLVADWNTFDTLDEVSLHALRKRIKRQRYAVEFFAPLLRRQQVRRYLEAVAAIQDRMGEFNDLVVARARYQALVASEPAAWFALGWLAARLAEVRALARSELGRLAKAAPPSAARRPG